jgi:ABC-type transporter Mla maintaining outer membrane lipid asymmetry permease subunit MlaE
MHAAIEKVGRQATDKIIAFGDFCSFSAKTFSWLFGGGLRPKSLRNLIPQLYDIGVSSIPVAAASSPLVQLYVTFRSAGGFPAFTARLSSSTTLARSRSFIFATS